MSEEINKDGVETPTPEPNDSGESKDSIADALENAPKPKEETPKEEAPKEEVPKEDKDGDGDKKKFFKKVGNHTFETEADYDAWASKNYGEVSRLQGELKKALSKAENPEATPKEQVKAEQDITSLRWKIKTEEFFEDHKDAEEYRPVMAAFIRSGKASDESGRPSLQKAYEMALRADGKEPALKEDAEKNLSKKLMQSGGGEGGRTYSNPYTNEDSLKSISDFADKAIFRGK